MTSNDDPFPEQIFNNNVQQKEKQRFLRNNN